MKIIVSIICNATPNREPKKNMKKIKKHRSGLFPSEPRLGKAEKEWKKKIIVSIIPYLTPNRELKKNSQKI